MNPIKTIYCRTVQAVLRAALPVSAKRKTPMHRPPPGLFRPSGS